MVIYIKMFITYNNGNNFVRFSHPSLNYECHLAIKRLTLAFAGTTLISCTMMTSGLIMRTTGLFEVCVIQYISPVWPGISDHCTNGWLVLPPLPPPLLKTLQDY